MNLMVVEFIQKFRQDQVNSLVQHDFQPLRDDLKNTVSYYKGKSIKSGLKQIADHNSISVLRCCDSSHDEKFLRRFCIPKRISSLLSKEVNSVLFQFEYLHHLIEHRKYTVVSQDDLFQDILEANPELDSNLPASLGEIMDQWTNGDGLPIVSVSYVGNGSLTLKQVCLSAE